MISRRNWQLQQLGITQWVLKRPLALHGEIFISIFAHVRLLMVAENSPALEGPVVGDVLRALRLSPDQVLQLTPAQLVMLPDGYRCNSWRLGVAEEIMLDGSHIVSPALDELIVSPAARRALWQQICKYEHNFFPCKE